MKYTRSFITIAILLTAGATIAANSITFVTATAIMSTPDLGVGYFTFTSAQDDTLTSLTSPCCDAVELHTMSMKNDMMQMRKLDSLDLKAGVPVMATVAGHGGDRDSMHLMLIGVHQSMKRGQRFPVTFHFANQGDKIATFTVIERGAKTTAGAASGAQH